MDSESFQQFSRLFDLISASLFAGMRPMRSPLFALKFEFDSGPFPLENLGAERMEQGFDVGKHH